MNEEAVRRDVLRAFEYSYLHDDWVNPLEEALAGVTRDQALWRSGPESTCIWEIVLHMAVWNDNIVQRVESGEPVHPAEGAWPPLPPVWDETAWEAAKQYLWHSLESVRAMLESTPLEKVQGSAYGLADLFCRFNHIAYHIGQITKMRECMPA